jgi:hypothetical protein
MGARQLVRTVSEVVGSLAAGAVSGEQTGGSVTHLKRLDSRASTRALAGLLSVVLHLGLLLLILVSGGRRDGIDDDDTPVTRLVLLDADSAVRREGAEMAVWNPAMPTRVDGTRRDFLEIEPPTLSPAEFEMPPDEADDVPLEEIEVPDRAALSTVVEPLAALVMPRAQASELLRRVERLAQELVKAPRARSTWQQDGRDYDAELVLQPATDGVEPDRVIAQISAEDKGRQLRTRIMLKRLPFSHFAQLIDRWDPEVQLHDDRIVGRMHINSQFNLLYDSQATPTFLGRVTTAAGGFTLRSQGRRREAEVFREGIETGAARIPLAVQTHAFERARHDGSVRAHEIAHDAAITFFPNGGYAGRDRRTGSSLFSERPSARPVYFIAARGATVYVQGVVSGRFLVYSPQRIVVEGNLVYAHDPREDPDSDDYLGLVCDKDIVVAPPRVTGPGDLHIHAALFARRRVVVTHIEHPDPATLEIFGSLAAGTLTASEPRYATKVEYDWRFERQRPPGFPSTDQFAAEDWDGRWTEVTDESKAAAF